MTYLIYYILLSYSLGISSPCSDKLSLYLKLQKDTIYTYQNSISVTKWPRNNEAAAKNMVNSFKSSMYPLAMGAKGYTVYEVISSAQNNDLLEIIAKPPVRLPMKKEYPFYPVAQLEGAYAGNPVPLREVLCEKVFKMSETETSADGRITFSKTSINKIAGIEDRRIKVNVKGKEKTEKLRLIRLESRKDVTLSGSMEGSGTEKVTLYLIEATREPYEEIRSFKYEYLAGSGDSRKAEVMTGEYKSKMMFRERYKKPSISFPDITSKENKVPYYTNGTGLFIPVTMESTISTKMYIIPTSESSYIDYNFYVQNFPEKPKNYFYPVNRMDIGANVVENPGVEITNKADVKIDYKIPGVIGKDIISRSIMTINDKKRTLSISEPESVRKIPPKSLLFDLVNKIPVFELTINGSMAKTTISFDTDEPQISRKLVKQLGLDTIKIAGSKDRPGENIIEKVNVIVTPTDRTYFRTQATVMDFGEDAYDFKLGLDYIEGKELTINYKDSWLLIRDAK